MAFSQQIITDLRAARNLSQTATGGAGVSAVTAANSVAPAGPIMDMPGMIANVLLKAEELKINLQNVLLNVDTGTDAALATSLTNISNTLV